jgi:pSer/pThr/pTyr-binding forkhead associated (FHA) protein
MPCACLAQEVEGSALNVLRMPRIPFSRGWAGGKRPVRLLTDGATIRSVSLTQEAATAVEDEETQLDRTTDEEKTQIATAPTTSEVTQAVEKVSCPVCGFENLPGDKYCADCGFLLTEEPGAALDMEAAEAVPRLVSVTQAAMAFTLREGEHAVGREGPDVLIPDSTVSRKHAQITVSGDTVKLVDLGSTNGTTVNGSRIAANEDVELKANDEIGFGATTFRLLMPGVEAGPPKPRETEEEPETPEQPEPESILARLVGTGGTKGEFFVTKEEIQIGRREGDILIKDSYCSGRHAQLVFEDDGWHIVDLGSTNGSFVNGEKIEPDQKVEIKDGDEITLGQSTFLFKIEPPKPEEAEETAEEPEEEPEAPEPDTAQAEN